MRETWESLVVPNHELFIGLLIAFEATAGALVSFGWAYLVWSIPLVVALSLLRRAERTSRDRTVTDPLAREVVRPG